MAICEKLHFLPVMLLVDSVTVNLQYIGLSFGWPRLGGGKLGVSERLSCELYKIFVYILQILPINLDGT